jgi:hypothetical protein
MERLAEEPELAWIGDVCGANFSFKEALDIHRSTHEGHPADFRCEIRGAPPLEAQSEEKPTYGILS